MTATRHIAQPIHYSTCSWRYACLGNACRATGQGCLEAGVWHSDQQTCSCLVSHVSREFVRGFWDPSHPSAFFLQVVHRSGLLGLAAALSIPSSSRPS